MDVNLQGNNNSLNDIISYSNNSTSYKYLSTGITFFYKNDIKITQDNFINVFDFDGDGKVTKEDLAEYNFYYNLDVSSDGDVSTRETNYLKELARIMVTGKLSDGTKVAEPLFDIEDETFTTAENLAQAAANLLSLNEQYRELNPALEILSDQEILCSTYFKKAISFIHNNADYVVKNYDETTEKTTLKRNFDGQGNNLMTQEGATFVINGKEQTYADIWHKKLEE